MPGSRHDSAALSLCGWDDILAGADWIADTAYTAHGALTPLKKTPGRDRLRAEKSLTEGRIIHARRYRAHDLATLKKWKILSTGYRHRLARLSSIITLATKLKLYRIGR